MKSTSGIVSLASALMILVGAVGIASWSDRTLAIMETLVIRDPLLWSDPGSAARLASCGCLFAVGVIVTAAVCFIRKLAVSPLSRWIAFGSALAFLPATIILLLSTLSVWSAFRVIATSSTAPNASELQPLVESIARQFGVAWWIGVAGAIGLLIATVISRPDQVVLRRHPLHIVGATIAALAAFGFAAGWVMIWNQSASAASLMSGTPKPAALARDIVSSITATAVIGITLGIISFGLALSAWFQAIHEPVETTD